MRPRTLSIFTLAALIGAVIAVSPASAAPEVTLQVNQSCVELNWQCWTAETSGLYPHPTSKVTITEGGEVEFVEHDASTPAGVSWIGAEPACTGVPATATPADWQGSCKFAQPGLYMFESATMFEDAYENYKKYEIAVRGTPKAKTTPTSTGHQTEATLTGSVEPVGNPTEYHFAYGSASVSEHSSAPTGLGASDFTGHSVSLPVSGLLPDTEYHFELIVSYGAGKTVAGGVQAFKTPPAAQPTVGTLAASDLKETEATLNGKVDPEGGANAVYFFEWGAGSGGSYEHITEAVSLPSDGAEHQVSATITGLTPGGEYHFRVGAKNGLGSVQGTDFAFTASATPPTKEPTKEPPAKEPSPTSTPTGGGSTATGSGSPASGQPGTASSSPLLESFKLAPTQRSSSVRGAVNISQAGAGGRLVVTLLASSASAKAGHSSKVRVGRLLRSSLHAGLLSFAVPVTAKARSLLRRHKRLELTVQIVITPIHGTAVTVTKSVVLRD